MCAYCEKKSMRRMICDIIELCVRVIVSMNAIEVDTISFQEERAFYCTFFLFDKY